MIEVKLVKYRQVEAELLDLFRASFGRDMNPDFWNWKHAGNYLSPTDPELIVAMDKDKIVGARPFLFVEMWLGKEKIKAAQHVDTMVHPEYQGQGLFNLMGQYSLEYLKENGYALSYGFANALSRRGFLKQGYQIIGVADMMFKVLRGRNIMTRYLKNELLGSLAGTFYDRIFVRKPKALSGLTDSINFIAADQFTEELRDVDALRDSRAIDLVRSESFLRWRYDAHPHFKYKYIVLKRQDELAGYAVISARREDSGLTHGLIADFLVKNNDEACFRVLLDKCYMELDQLGCDYVNIWIVSQFNQMNKLLKRYGLRSVLKFPHRKQYRDFLLDAILIQEQIAEPINIYDRENWRLSAAFTDTR
jgi:GNAT superfamily N-acetyltransferase